jgi:hypothetical protein
MLRNKLQATSLSAVQADQKFVFFEFLEEHFESSSRKVSFEYHSIPSCGGSGTDGLFGYAINVAWKDANRCRATSLSHLGKRSLLVWNTVIG